MELTEADHERIAPYLPVRRGNVSMSNLQVLNAILHVAEHGCKWRGLPARFGNWHAIYTRMNRWSKSGVLDRVFEQLQRQRLVRIKLEAVSLDSTSVQVHPDGTGAPKKIRNPSASPEEMERQDSCGCRGCSHGRDVLDLSRRRARRAGMPQAAAPPGAAEGASAPARGAKPGSWRWTSVSGPLCRPRKPRESLAA